MKIKFSVKELANELECLMKGIKIQIIRILEQKRAYKQNN